MYKIVKKTNSDNDDEEIFLWDVKSLNIPSVGDTLDIGVGIGVEINKYKVTEIKRIISVPTEEYPIGEWTYVYVEDIL